MNSLADNQFSLQRFSLLSPTAKVLMAFAYFALQLVSTVCVGPITACTWHREETTSWSWFGRELRMCTFTPTQCIQCTVFTFSAKSVLYMKSVYRKVHKNVCVYLIIYIFFIVVWQLVAHRINCHLDAQLVCSESAHDCCWLTRLGLFVDSSGPAQCLAPAASWPTWSSGGASPSWGTTQEVKTTTGNTNFSFLFFVVFLQS